MEIISENHEKEIEQYKSIIQGLLVTLKNCFHCNKPATKFSSLTTPPDKRYFCDSHSEHNSIDLSYAETIRKWESLNLSNK